MATEQPHIEAVHRREAKSGNVSYGTPVILHETSRRRVQLIPFFYPSSDGGGMSVKIETHQKLPPPLNYVVKTENRVSLDEAAARKLLQALTNHFAVAKEGGDGDYLVIRVSEGTANFGKHDPAEIAGALAKVLGQPEIVKHLAQTELGDQLTKAFRGAIRLSEMQRAVADLRDKLDRGEKAEQVYQEWCETHTWAFGNAYVMRDEVREITPGDNLDILLPTVITGYRDIVELKRPDMQVLNYDGAHRNYYFASDVSKAVGQCHRYLDVLHEVAARGLRDHPEIVAYHPRAVIVIGRSVDWGAEKLKALHGLNCRMNGISVMTYDQLLAQGERLIEILSASATSHDAHYEAAEMHFDPSEIPF